MLWAGTSPARSFETMTAPACVCRNAFRYLRWLAKLTWRWLAEAKDATPSKSVERFAVLLPPAAPTIAHKLIASFRPVRRESFGFRACMGVPPPGSSLGNQGSSHCVALTGKRAALPSRGFWNIEGRR
jgi:hypothetical protein